MTSSLIIILYFESVSFAIVFKIYTPPINRSRR